MTVLLAVFAGSVFALGQPAHAACNWDDTFTPPGLDGQIAFASVNAIARSGSDLYVAGTFTVANGLVVNRVAKWNGSSWSALGTGIGSGNAVYALAVDAFGNLYAGGSFTSAGGSPANNIAKWNGSSWSALGTGTSATVRTLVIDSSGILYAGGDFLQAGGNNAALVAKWNGTTWSALSTGTTNGNVNALAFDGLGNLYAGGSFTSIHGTAANRIAMWNGASWSALGTGFGATTSVAAIAIDGSNVYVGGNFLIGGGNPGNYIATWNGSTWSALGSGFDGVVNGLRVDAAHNLIAVGNFTHSGATTMSYVAKWNGSTWSAMASGVSGLARAIEYDSGGTPYVGGDFIFTGSGAPASYFAYWNGSAWVGPGITGQGIRYGGSELVESLASDPSGNLYAGGTFGAAGTTNFASRIAKWNGSAWSTLGTGMNNFHVYALLTQGSDVYAGGDFSTAGGTSVFRIAKWSGTAWSALGPGLNNNVYALAKDSLGNVYAGGGFTATQGGVANSLNRVGKWDGSSWVALGSGIGASNVYAIAINAATNRIYVGGDFTTAGGNPANRVAMWDGTAWSALGSGMNATVRTLAVDFAGNVYAGGEFTSAGGGGANFIAKWNGTVWSALGTGMNSGVNGSVKSLAFDSDGNLYAGGFFSTAGGVAASYIAKWNGSSWSAVNGGANSTVNAVIARGTTEVIIGGEFYTTGSGAGLIPNSRVGRLVCAVCGDSVISGSEACDEGVGNGSSTSCCTSACAYRAGGQICRPDAGECDIAETCTGSSGACPADLFEPATVPCSTDGNACTDDHCNAAGTCVHTDNTASCNDGDACTYNDTCAAGSCTGTSITCTSDACTTRTCNGTASCTVTPLTGTGCNDGDACTYNDTCATGACVGTMLTCTSDVCNTRVCNGTASCSVTPLTGAACSDGDPCTYNDTCSATGSCGGTALTCTSDACNTRICNGTASCTVTPLSGSSCDDGNACTQSDACQNGSCVGSSAVVCPLPDQCHDAGTCNPATGQCSNPAKVDGTSCTDGDACTQSDTCQGGHCVGANAVGCTALDQCHDIGACNPTTGQCTNPAKADGVPCSDGDACTQADTCQNGSCVAGTAVVCPPPDQCHDPGQCNPATGICTAPTKADGISCDNPGNLCFQTHTCQGGSCTSGNPVACTPLDQCHDAGTCNASTGQCSNPAKSNGVPCDDHDACTVGESCQGGNCESPTTTVTCSPQDQCHAPGVCNITTGQCTTPTRPDGVACNDGNACTLSDACRGGSCTGSSAVVCSALDQCHATGTCSPTTGQCSAPAKPDGAGCDDHDACTSPDHCTAGVCVAGGPVVCDDGEACTTDTCDAVSGCTSSPIPACTPQCGATPRPDCQPAAAARALLKLRSGSLGWKWISSAQVTKDDLGTPASTTTYVFCLYDATGLLETAQAPAGGLCTGKPCWTTLSWGFKYGSKDGLPDGLQKLKLKTGSALKSKLDVKGRGAALKLPPLPLTTPVRAQLRRGDGGPCWEARYPTPIVNTAAGFKAKSE